MIQKGDRYARLTEGFERDPKYWVEYLKLVFSEDVGRLMDEQEMNQSDLASKLGTTRAYITRLFHGTFNPTIETLVKVALALNARVALHLHPSHTAASWLEAPVSTRTLTGCTLAAEPLTKRWSDKTVASKVSAEVASESTTNAVAA